MMFKKPIWVPIAWILALVNVVATGFAAGEAEPWHATIHATLAGAFALWAEHLRRRRVRDDDPSLAELRQEVEELHAESQRQIAELNERLDFAERLLAQDRMTQGIKPPGSQ